MEIIEVFFLPICFCVLMFLGRSIVVLVQSEWMHQWAQYIIATAPYVLTQPLKFIYEWIAWGVVEPIIWILFMLVEAIYFMGGPIFILCCLFFVLTLYAFKTVSKLTRSLENIERRLNGLKR